MLCYALHRGVLCGLSNWIADALLFATITHSLLLVDSFLQHGRFLVLCLHERVDDLLVELFHSRVDIFGAFVAISQKDMLHGG